MTNNRTEDRGKGKVIVCGIGNTLLQDEGVGVHLVRELKKLPLPASVELIEAGTMLLDYLFELREARQVILIDAMKADGPPGSVYLLDAEELLQNEVDHPLSLHQVGAVEILRIMALESNPPPCLVIGVEPASLEWGLDLSDALQAKVPEMLRVVQEQIRSVLPDSPKPA